MTARLALLAAALLAAAPIAALARGPFETNLLEVPGRVLDTVTQDFTGDGEEDLLVIHVIGLPPDEKRRISLFVGTVDGPPARKPDQTLKVPAQVAAFDAANIDGVPGVELLLLDRTGLSLVPLAEGRFGAPRRLFARPLLAGGPEEGNLPRVSLTAWPDGKDADPGLVLPDLEGLLYFPPRAFKAGAPAPEPQRLRVELRYSYRSWSGTSGSQVLSARTTVPGPRTGDHDGDGKNELFFLWDDEVEVFGTDAGGRFKPDPVARYAMDVRTRQEKKLRNASVKGHIVDLDGDGISDLVLSKTSGGFMDMKGWVHIYPGHKGGRFDAKPSQVIECKGLIPMILPEDVNGDGNKDLVIASVEIGIIALSQMLIKSELKVDFAVHVNAGGGVPDRPNASLEIPFRINFTRGADVQGAVPVFGKDFNGDGIPDLIHGRGVDALEIHLGDKDEEELFKDHFRARLKAPATPHMKVSSGKRPGVVLFYRNIPKFDGKIFWFRNRNPW